MDEILFGKFYYKLRQGVITNCGSSLYYKLRQGVITNCDRYVITNSDKFYYKLRQVLQIATTVITNCDRYYNLRQVLQIATVQNNVSRRNFQLCYFNKDIKDLLFSRHLFSNKAYKAVLISSLFSQFTAIMSTILKKQFERLKNSNIIEEQRVLARMSWGFLQKKHATFAYVKRG